jgi:hypothetical protein
MTKDSDQEVKSQTVITGGTIISAAINGIVGYIAVYFFQPLWLRTVKWWHNDNK